MGRHLNQSSTSDKWLNIGPASVLCLLHNLSTGPSALSRTCNFRSQ
jgi:hypothetical protein